MREVPGSRKLLESEGAGRGDLRPDEVRVASLAGFRLVIAPRANLERFEGSTIFNPLP